jgi:hypothetical protein
VDAGLALAVAVIDVASTRGDGRDPGAYTLGLAVAPLVLFRRRWPLAVLLASGDTVNTASRMQSRAGWSVASR